MNCFFSLPDLYALGADICECPNDSGGISVSVCSLISYSFYECLKIKWFPKIQMFLRYTVVVIVENNEIE